MKKLAKNEVCFICNKIQMCLARHHINGDDSDNREENKIDICENCHNAIHNWDNYVLKGRFGKKIYMRKGDFLQKVEYYNNILKINEFRRSRKV